MATPVNPSTRIRRRRWGSSGQAMVEFGMVSILFFPMFFSIIEIALIMASIGAYNFSSRDAARLGSLIGRTDATVDTQVVADVANHVKGIVMAKEQEVDIYRASSDGTCLQGWTGQNTAPSIDDPTCMVNRYNPDGTLVSGTSVQWPPNARNDSVSSGDYLGVRVKYAYTYLTGFIASTGSVLNLTAISVQRIEPQGRVPSQAAPAIAQRGQGGRMVAPEPGGGWFLLAALCVRTAWYPPWVEGGTA